MSDGPWPPGVKPISPSEIPAAKANVIPDFVVAAINHLLSVHFNPAKGKLVIMDSQIVDEVMRQTNAPREFKHEWMNFEPLYAQEGWIVEYTPGEPDPFYTFMPKPTPIVLAAGMRICKC